MITSYCMNGSVANYSGSQITHRITSFKSDDVIFWETDENNQNRGAWHDASNQPRESLSGRHSSRGRRYKDYDTDDKVKGTIGNLDGTAEWILRRDDIPNNGDFDEIAYDKGGFHPRPNRLWNQPSNPLN